jgi:uncharacterized membrane protein
MSWLLLHTAAGQHYAGFIMKTQTKKAAPCPGACPRDLNFPGVSITLFNFRYFAFTVGLILAVSDVNVTSVDQCQFVLLYSVVSFFFFTTILGVVRNAIVTS